MGKLYIHPPHGRQIRVEIMLDSQHTSLSQSPFANLLGPDYPGISCTEKGPKHAVSFYFPSTYCINP